jgi:hypothetical protein
MAFTVAVSGTHDGQAGMGAAFGGFYLGGIDLPPMSGYLVPGQEVSGKPRFRGTSRHFIAKAYCKC